MLDAVGFMGIQASDVPTPRWRDNSESHTTGHYTLAPASQDARGGIWHSQMCCSHGH